MRMRSVAPSHLLASPIGSVQMRDLFSGLTWIGGSESTTWLAPTRSIRKPNSRQKASVMAVSYARSPQPRTLLLLQRKGIVESNRNRRELREHRAHESDEQTGGVLLLRSSEMLPRIFDAPFDSENRFAAQQLRIKIR